MKTGRPNTATPVPEKSKAYQDAIDYLYSRINFEKSQDQPYNQQNFRLSRMERLLVQMGNPQQASPVIHIAGSKGKGSVAWLTAEILRRSGFQTGLYTSPHLVCLEERFVINGSPISPDTLVRAIEAIAPAVDEIAKRGHGQATFFEITTAVAWWVFREAKCDVTVIEVGLGGRLDSTNVCWPTLSIVTSISFDHQLQLGNTLSEIAQEKAGIIKPGVPVISGVVNPEPRQVIHRFAQERGCQLRQLGRDFYCQPSYMEGMDYDRMASGGDQDSLSLQSDSFGDPKQQTLPPGCLIDYTTSESLWPAGLNRHKLRLRMLGDHQVANCGVVLAAVDLLREQGWAIPDDAVSLAMAETQLAGRIQVVSHSPLIILDTAHNEASIAALITALKQHFPGRKLKFVFAASRDKKYSLMLEQLYQVASEILLTQFEHNPRTVSVEELMRLMTNLHETSEKGDVRGQTLRKQSHSYNVPGEALRAAVRDWKPDELVCITGSFFLAAELIPVLHEEFPTQLESTVIGVSTTKK